MTTRSPLAGTHPTTNMKLQLKDQDLFRKWMRTLPTRDDWLAGEPHIHEMMADPIVRLVMRRDNLGPADVWAAIDRARTALRGPEVRSRDVA